MKTYESFKEKVRSGDFGKTPKFWMDYMDKIWLVLRLLRATKLNDLDLHVACLYKLCPLFSAMIIQIMPGILRYIV